MSFFLPDYGGGRLTVIDDLRDWVALHGNTCRVCGGRYVAPGSVPVACPHAPYGLCPSCYSGQRHVLEAQSRQFRRSMETWFTRRQA